eukprot:NODE_6469_length_1669_cov_4.754864.p1 GENE.NODE_6469_length_1669_cov_4.754864~~NODE_6469_length_1669_cov_4.754864.p1  ORF type:complete len:508 (-),score=193.55 NODE_6469_length_1669_cov_4.754864:145-1560(-)
MCDHYEELCSGPKPESMHELQADCKRDLGQFYATRLKFSKTCSEHPVLCSQVWRGEKGPREKQEEEEDKKEGADVDEGSKLTFRCSADRCGATGIGAGPRDDDADKPPIVWDEVFPEVVRVGDVEEEDNKLAEEVELVDGEDAGDTSGRSMLVRESERVRLPVHFRPLHAIVERRVRRANTAFLRCRSDNEAQLAAEHAAAVEKGEEAEEPLAMPSPAAVSFEAAREIFKLANYYFSQALCSFPLDGWVTEHVKILQELSQIYRTLVWWEKDPKRIAAMMVRRARMLTPLLEQLNPRVYVAFWRQLSFEAGEMYQEMFELKAHGKKPGSPQSNTVDDDEDDAKSAALDPMQVARANELARKSIKFYDVFVESYHTNKKVPEKIDADNVRVYLTARLNRTRLRTKFCGLGVDENVELHTQSFREYEWILDYGARNPEVRTDENIGMTREIKLCEDMAAMLPAKLSRMAAKRR